jgi:DNA/RNA-binding domain of Phe-tRNA-synthetase-like protein
VTSFRYDPAIIERYPTIRAGVVFGSGFANGPSSDALLDQYSKEQRAVSARLTEVPIAEHLSIAAWRRAFSAFGVKPTRHRAAPEALLRRLSKAGDIPSINTLVDIGNLVSIRFGLPVAAMDLAKISGDIMVAFADGSEVFTDLGADEPTHPDEGEVVFVDAANIVCARRWCWRQSAQSATGLGSADVMFVVEGLHDAAIDDVAAALEDLVTLLSEHCRADLATHLLSATNPTTS